TSVNNAGMSAACPPGYTFVFSATITANGPGNVTYDWEFSDGHKTDVQTLEYTAAGSKVVTASWEVGNGGEIGVGETYNGWARITINDPNHQVFPRASFNMACTP
ncbi:MAG: hypothetical protein LWX83_09655, partial [Anaerolineae bacterium]|nr:hypothetical protein [Anaerolineae bacterium]